jgi:hypothetical protein
LQVHVHVHVHAACDEQPTPRKHARNAPTIRALPYSLRASRSRGTSSATSSSRRMVQGKGDVLGFCRIAGGGMEYGVQAG